MGRGTNCEKEIRQPIIAHLYELGIATTQISDWLRITHLTLREDLRELQLPKRPKRTNKEVYVICLKEFTNSYVDQTTKPEDPINIFLADYLGISQITTSFPILNLLLTGLAMPGNEPSDSCYIDLLFDIFGDEKIQDNPIIILFHKYLTSLSLTEAKYFPDNPYGLTQSFMLFTAYFFRSSIGPIWPANASDLFDEIFETLLPNEKLVIEQRYGIGTPKQTLRDIALQLDVTKERIRQIQFKALQKLRHPSRRNKLLKLWELKTVYIPPKVSDPEMLAAENLAASTIEEEPEVIEAKDKLSIKLADLDISVRSFNCLVNNSKIITIGDLITRTERDLLKIQNFGRKSLRELEDILDDMGLHLVKSRR
jgi:hypothetical protein